MQRSPNGHIAVKQTSSGEQVGHSLHLVHFSVSVKSLSTLIASARDISSVVVLPKTICRILNSSEQIVVVTSIKGRQHQPVLCCC